MPQNIPYRDPREQYMPEAAGLPGSPVTIQGAGGFGPEGAYESGTQTAYVPAAGQPIYGQGVNPQAASYLQNVGRQDEQLNAAYKEQYISDKKAKRAALEQEYGKDFADYYDLLRSGPNPLPINDAKKEAWAYKMKREDLAAKLDLAKQSQEGRPYFTDAGVDPNTGRHMIFNTRTGQYEPSSTSGMFGPKTRRPLPASEIDALNTFDSLADTAQRLLTVQETLPELTGPIQGRVRDIKSRLINDPTFAAFKRDLDSLIETSYALSGKQISEKEIRMLESLRGQLTQPDENFRASMEGYRDWLNKKREGRVKEYENQGYMVPGPNPYIDNSQQPIQPAGGEEPYPAPAGQKWQHNKDKSQWRLVPAR